MGLRCPDAAIRFTRTIPLRNGLQIRADAKCSPMGWKRFLEEANKVGTMKVLNEEDMKEDMKVRGL